MGAYANPETAVDTQSGQYIREAIGSIATSTEKYIQLASKKQADIIKNNKDAAAKAATYTTAYNTSVNEVGKGQYQSDNDPYFQEFKGRITETAAKAYSKNPGVDVASNITKLDKLQKGSLKSLNDLYTQIGVTANNYKEMASNDMGTDGGEFTGAHGVPSNMEDVVKNERTRSAVLRNVGFSKNAFKPIPIFDSEHNIIDVQGNIEATNTAGEKVDVKPFTLSGLTSYNSGNQGTALLQLPKVAPMIDDMKMKTPLLQKKTNAKDAQIVTDKLDLAWIKNIPGAYKTGTVAAGASTTSDTNLPLKNTYIQTIIPDKKVIAANPEIMKMAEAKVAALSANQTKLNMYYNDVLYKFDPDFQGDDSMVSNVFNSEEGVKKHDQMVTAFANYFVHQAMPKDVYPDEDPLGKPVIATEIHQKQQLSEAEKTSNAINRSLAVSDAKDAKLKAGYLPQYTSAIKNGGKFGNSFYDKKQNNGKGGWMQLIDEKGINLKRPKPIDETAVIAAATHQKFTSL